MEYLTDLRAVTAGEVPLVEQFAAVYSRWLQSEIDLANGDPGWRTVVTRQGTDGSSVPTPAMLTNRTALEQLRKLATALGLSPVDRAKLPASRVGGEEDPMDVLLAKRSA
jgi:phage terminase small subunit